MSKLTSFYFPVDAPWGAEEDKTAQSNAREKFDELKNSGMQYVVLIRSHNIFSHGYWIETERIPLSDEEVLIDEHLKQ